MQLGEQFDDHGGPSGLMAGANTGAVIAVEVLVEEQQILPMGIALKQLHRAIEWTMASLITAEEPHQAFLQLQ